MNLRKVGANVSKKSRLNPKSLKTTHALNSKSKRNLKPCAFNSSDAQPGFGPRIPADGEDAVSDSDDGVSLT